MAFEAQFVHVLLGYLDAGFILIGVQNALTFSPVLVRVPPIRFTTVSKLIRGLPFQFRLMKENSRCSILFHLLVPGG